MKKIGRYDVVGVLGSGAMGWVYECRDPNLDRRVALKTIKVENLSERAASEYEVRFKVEARSAARLQHPHIVSVYDADRDSGVAFLVMEFIDGHDLKYHLDSGKLYSLKETVDIMVALLSALEYAHSQHIVHRDVKPANLLIDLNGCLKLTDFGVARIQNSGELTQTQGSVVGTLKYMSPEQIQSLPVDSRADLFAAGVVLYQLLTGLRPFEANSDFGVIQKIVSHSPEAVTSLNPSLPPAVDTVVNCALEKSRDKRFASASEFSKALLQACRETDAWQVIPSVSSGAPRDDFKRISAATHEPAPPNDNATTVTQEIELVYWKEIRESIDVEDLNVFLTQFPNGIYAPLAQRRIKQLNPSTEENSSTREPTRSNIDRMPAADDTTLPHRYSSESASASLPIKLVKQGTENRRQNMSKTVPETAAVALTGKKIAKKRSAFQWIAGLMLALIGLVSAWSVLQKGDNKEKNVIFAETSVMRQTMVLSESISEPAVRKPLIAPDLPLKTKTTPVPTVSAEAIQAEKVLPAIKSKKSSQDETIKIKPATLALSTDSSIQKSQAFTKTMPADPRQFCEDRILLGFQMCLLEQCQKVAFFNHSTCVERRQMDQTRRENEQFR